MARTLIIGVMGGGSATSEVRDLATKLGTLIADWGATLLCGGGSGVMEAAARGAKDHDPPGATIGILPGMPGESRPNAFIDLPIHTGLRDARNYINVVSSDVVVALEGGAGTLSEIALGLKVGTPVVCLGSWTFLANASFDVHCVETADDAIARAFTLAGCRRGEAMDRPLRFPDFPDQAAHREQLRRFIERTGEKTT